MGQVNFYIEEALMQTNGYPGLERQQRQHKHFKSHVAELETSLAESNLTDAKRISTFMKDWLLNHILEEDKAFALYVKIKSQHDFIERDKPNDPMDPHG